ncbi:energy transducer TonB, partial [Siccirubricoccus sp. KC 17139]
LPPPPPPPPRPALPRQLAARASPPPAAAPAPRAAAPQLDAMQTLPGSAMILGATTGATPLFRPPEPRYPNGARLRNETGTARVRVQVDEQGRVAAVEIVTSSGSAELDQAAREYFRQWRWTPAKRDGVPVASNVTTAITFRLNR